MSYDFDTFGPDDPILQDLASGNQGYYYGDTNNAYGQFTNTYGQDPNNWNWNFDFNSAPNIPNFDFQEFNLPTFNENQDWNIPQDVMDQLQFTNPSAYDYYNFGTDYNPQEFDIQQYLDPYSAQIGFDQTSMLQDQLQGFNGITDITGQSGWNNATVDLPQQQTQEPSLLEGIKSGLGSLGSLLGPGSALLPLLFLGSGALASNSAGSTAKTIQQIAEDEQTRNQAAIDALNNFIATGQGRPNPADYGSGQQYNIGPSENPYLSQLQAAINDPRYGLQEWMDAEGGRRAEAAARKMAASGRTGLAPMTSLEAMRDYLANGRKAKIGEMQGLAGLYNQRDIAAMQAAAQQANAEISAGAQRYNADMGYYRDVMGVLQRQADPSNYINTLLAAAQAQGQQYNPLLNSIAMYMGMGNR